MFFAIFYNMLQEKKILRKKTVCPTEMTAAGYTVFCIRLSVNKNLNEILTLLRFFIDKQQRNGYNCYKIYTKHKLESNFCLLDMLFFR